MSIQRLGSTKRSDYQVGRRETRDFAVVRDGPPSDISARARRLFRFHLFLSSACVRKRRCLLRLRGRALPQYGAAGRSASHHTRTHARPPARCPVFIHGRLESRRPWFIAPPPTSRFQRRNPSNVRGTCIVTTGRCGTRRDWCRPLAMTAADTRSFRHNSDANRKRLRVHSRASPALRNGVRQQVRGTEVPHWSPGGHSPGGRSGKEVPQKTAIFC